MGGTNGSKRESPMEVGYDVPLIVEVQKCCLKVDNFTGHSILVCVGDRVRCRNKVVIPVFGVL